MSVLYFPANRSESDSSVSTGPTLDFPKQPSIESFFPADKSESETDGSTISESNKTTLAAAQLLSYSIVSIFPPAHSYKSDTDYGGSVSNEPTPDFSKQLSIPSFFPPDRSESDTNENYETQFSYSIVSFFPPDRSLTDSSQYYEIIPTHTSITTMIDSVGYIFDKFWSSQSVPILDLNSSESSLKTLTAESTLREKDVTYFVSVVLLATVFSELPIFSELHDVPPFLKIRVVPPLLLVQVSYMPLRYLRWLKKSLRKRTIAISSTTQK